MLATIKTYLGNAMKKLILKKVKIDGAIYLAPLFSQDKAILKELGDTFTVEVKKARSLMQHRRFYAICRVMCDNDIFQYFPIKQEVMVKMKEMFKKDVDVLVYILKYLFLPHELLVTPRGAEFYAVNSISFSKLKQKDFNVFYKKSVGYMCQLLNITEDQIEFNNEDYEEL